MKINRSHFFSRYRTNFGKLSQKQVDGLNFLLDKLENDVLTLEQAAYVLATVKHETDSTFQPIKEKRGRVGTKIRAIQDKYWGTGFYGRGLVQLTHQVNYKKAGQALGVDLVGNPDLALDPEISYEITSQGMRKGWFTGKKLTDYIIAGDVDYVQARRIVNGLDRANDIADIADKFETILRGSLVTKSVTEDIKREAEEVLQKKGPEESATSPQPEPEVKTQEPEPPAALQAPKPTVTPVEAPPASITTKVAATVGAIGPVIAATGLKIGGVEFSTGGIVAIAAVIIVGMVISAWLWNQSQERRERRQRLSMENLASDTKSNVIAAGSKV